MGTVATQGRALPGPRADPPRVDHPHQPDQWTWALAGKCFVKFLQISGGLLTARVPYSRPIDGAAPHARVQRLHRPQCNPQPQPHSPSAPPAPVTSSPTALVAVTSPWAPVTSPWAGTGHAGCMVVAPLACCEGNHHPQGPQAKDHVPGPNRNPLGVCSSVCWCCTTPLPLWDPPKSWSYPEYDFEILIFDTPYSWLPGAPYTCPGGPGGSEDWWHVCFGEVR